MGRRYWVYILASRRNGTLYVGMTSELARRIKAHKDGLMPDFTRNYGVRTLVHLESYDNPDDALTRERRLKRWKRAWKIALIEENNPDWRDLTAEID